MNNQLPNIFIKKKHFYLVFIFLIHLSIYAQRGYYDAPYKRYEANLGQLSNGATVTSKSYVQADLQSEASDQQCVNLSATNATVQWTITEAAEGLVIRYSVPDGQSATLGVYNGNTKITTLTLTSTWSWEYLWSNGNPNNNGITNQNPRMRFDEVRYKLPAKIPVSGILKLVRETGNIHLDFAEMEPVPTAITAPSGSVTYTGNGSNLQSFIDQNGGSKIYIPSGVYNVSTELYFGVNNTSLIGAGMWYTQINFTATSSGNGGLRGNATNISFSDLYLTTNSTSRSNSYKAINGVFTSTSTIKNIWAEHFECGAWIAQYNVGGPAIADGFTLSHCRFRNNYADGINLCKGTSNAIVEHCNFRNNGDDDQAIWPANGQECINNTFRYNTSENCWRACGLAIYGGKNNKAYNLIIKDNLEAAIRVSNNFDGAPFSNDGSHEIHDITITACGTFNDTYNNPVAAVDIFSASNAGTQVKNVQLYNLDILDSRNDAISISKRSGDGIYNLSFNNITINGTGKEFPYNNALNRDWGRGYFVLIASAPNGNATYCNMNYSNRGGNATTNENTSGAGTFSWSAGSGCSGTSVVAVTSVTVTPTSATLNIGATLQLTPTVLPSNATNKSVTYSSGNTGVATVNTSGLVTAVSAGTATITVTTVDGNKTTNCAITVNTTPSGNYYTIKNRWTNNYLYDAGANVGYGATIANNNYKWQKVAIDATYYVLQNVGTGDIMNIENLTGSVQCTAGPTTWWSAQWSSENVDGTWVRIKNRWQTGSMIHIENLNGSAQYIGAQNNWESAQWLFETAISARIGMSNEDEQMATENNSLITIYPNPSTNNEFYISMPELQSDDVATITITDINGRQVLINRLKGSGKINHNFASGIYLVTISSNIFKTYKKLIVK
ncbi:Ig-like domain-containing protein [Flavobacterium sp. AG291]|uniref:Ig-like domain-containing protein n=1 Tax=Flavobacterium sp. AG291 TaxID=2184000 RepID=UPI000E0AC581|nr:Ig-like domain-containing protein [Flavobacterium sp. AG291]RDI04498.1 putative secreted protein (Por secretion system target) [Flavobacterium sp. AG291]